MFRVDTPFKKTRRQHPIPFELNGSFEWLKHAKAHKQHIGVPSKRKLVAQLKGASTSAAQQKITLPEEFVRFCESSNLQSKLRSATDCYLDVGKQVLPLDDGFLLRFLADSQGCAFWYLFVKPGSQDHAVALSTEYYDANDGDSADLSEISQKYFLFDSPSFECFLCRFWLENEIFFAEDEGTEPPDVGKKFLRMYSM